MKKGNSVDRTSLFINTDSSLTGSLAAGSWKTDRIPTPEDYETVFKKMQVSLKEKSQYGYEEQKGKQVREPEKEIQNGLRGSIPKYEGPIIKMCLTVRERTVIGWVDYFDKRLITPLRYKSFVATNNFSIGSESGPSLSNTYILLWGESENLNLCPMSFRTDSTANAIEYYENVLTALREFSSFVRGEELTNSLGTELSGSKVYHIF